MQQQAKMELFSREERQRERQRQREREREEKEKEEEEASAQSSISRSENVVQNGPAELASRKAVKVEGSVDARRGSDEDASRVAEEKPMVLHGGSEVLRRELLKKGWVLWDETCMGEFEWNLRWRSGRFRMSEITGACDRQKINHFPKSGILTKKDKLLRALRKAKVVFGGVYNFSHNPSFSPLSTQSLSRLFPSSRRRRFGSASQTMLPAGTAFF